VFFNEHRSPDIFWRLVFPQLLENTMSHTVSELRLLVRYPSNIENAHFFDRHRSLIIADEAQHASAYQLTDQKRQALLDRARSQLPIPDVYGRNEEMIRILKEIMGM
jgi:hypothetical protein